MQQAMIQQALRHDFDSLVDKLSRKIGFYWWRRYVAGAFWSNLESPLNLTLTLISTVISAQASTSSFMEQQHYVIMTFVSVILSTINTFYRPLSQVSRNVELLKSWYELGNELEKIYFAPRLTDDELRQRNDELHSLLIRVNQEIASQSPANQNFFTDFLHVVARSTCIRSSEPWLSFAQEAESNVSCTWRDWLCCFRSRRAPQGDRRQASVELTERVV